MNKETKEFLISEITFMLKIFCIIIGFTLLTATICYFIDIDGVKSVRVVISAALLACFFCIYVTLKRMKLP